MNLLKIFRLVTVLLSLAGAIFLVLIISTGDTAITAAYDAQENTNIVDNMAYIAYVTLGLILAFVAIFVIKNLFTNKGSLKSTLIGAGAFVSILVISYALSGGDTTVYKHSEGVATAGTSQLVGAGLVAFYILAALAIGSILFTGVKKLIK